MYAIVDCTGTLSDLAAYSTSALGAFPLRVTAAASAAKAHSVFSLLITLLFLFGLPLPLVEACLLPGTGSETGSMMLLFDAFVMRSNASG